jgi:hypothetical protein
MNFFFENPLSPKNVNVTVSAHRAFGGSVVDDNSNPSLLVLCMWSGHNNPTFPGW